MAKPRMIVPGDTLMVSRRCAQRTFLLNPSPAVEKILLFCLGVAAKIAGIELHAFVAMSNHVHMILTDPHGRLPKFMHWFSSMSARALNDLHGRTENLWAPGSYSAVRLLDRQAVLDAHTYLFSNPTKAGLVPHGTEWPGAMSNPSDWNRGDADQRKIRVERPEYFFGRKSNAPEFVDLEFTCPAILGEAPIEQIVEDVVARREEREAEIRAERDREGSGFLGTEAILSVSPEARPRSHENRFQLSPTLASKNKHTRVEAIQSLKDFRRKYRECWEKFRAGERTVVFPAGTWGPVHLYGARAAPFPKAA